MRIAFIGCVEFSRRVLGHIIGQSLGEICGVVTRKESNFNEDFQSLEPLVEKIDCPSFIAEGNNQTEMADWLSSLNPDIVYCFGWSYLLKAEILALPRLGVVGYHPALLPRGRGRHPIIWTLALGLERTGSTFFFMDEGADSGDILSQVEIPVSREDDAQTLYDKLTEIALRQVVEFSTDLSAGIVKRVEQDHSRATCWRKRGKLDGEIDWRMPTQGILNLVRALAKPYPGAHCVHGETQVKIWKTAGSKGGEVGLEPGKILDYDGDRIRVKTGDGVVQLIEHEFVKLPTPGSYL